MFEYDLLLALVLQDDSEAVKTPQDTCQAFAAGQVDVDHSFILAKLVEEWILDIDRAACGFGHLMLPRG